MPKRDKRDMLCPLCGQPLALNSVDRFIPWHTPKRPIGFVPYSVIERACSGVDLPLPELGQLRTVGEKRV